jgi:hypothetical protein
VGGHDGRHDAAVSHPDGSLLCTCRPCDCFDAEPFGPTAWFAAGYLLVWLGFASAATDVQWALDRAALLTPLASSEKATRNRKKARELRALTTLDINQAEIECP